jgi:very-short-patch-repair endonuclease
MGHLIAQVHREALRRGQLGVSFKREVRIGSFAVEFLAPDERLIVEVDGSLHVGRAVAEARWGRKLARLGYRLVRVRWERCSRTHPLLSASLMTC